MKFFRNLTIASSIVLTFSLPALAGVTVNSPANDAEVSTTFTLSAYASTCSSTNVNAMGYSFDSSSDTIVVNSQSIDKSISSSTGTHVLHVKAWGSNGAACVKDVTINVKSSVSGSSTSVVSIPSYADSVSSIESLGGWRAAHDTGGPGSSSGTMQVVSSPSKYGSSRQFVTSFTNNGDERYSVSLSDNVDAKNFFYDTWVYLTSSASMLANLEFDVNQTMSNGQTVLMGFQCDGWTGHWAYTVNTGSAGSPRPKWVSKSGTSCNPQHWSQNTWHHVQASFSRDSSGYITYHSIWFDGAETSLNVKVFGAASLGWGDVLQTQFQVDGYGSSGHVTAYLDGLKLSAW